MQHTGSTHTGTNHPQPNTHVTTHPTNWLVHTSKQQLGSVAHEHFNISENTTRPATCALCVAVASGGDIGPASEPPDSGNTITTNSNNICTHMTCHTSMSEAPRMHEIARVRTESHKTPRPTTPRGFWHYWHQDWLLDVSGVTIRALRGDGNRGQHRTRSGRPSGPQNNCTL